MKVFKKNSPAGCAEERGEPYKSNNRPFVTSGFVLPVVLVLLAIMMVAVMAVVGIMEQQRSQVLLQKKQWKAQQEIRNTAVVVKYLLASHPLNRAGLAVDVVPALPQYQDTPITGREIYLDGRWYAGTGDARFRIQDQSGLVALNFPDDPMLENYLQQHKVPYTQRKHLVGSLWDYIDSDDQRRLHGAEEQDYLRDKLQPPANRLLQLSQELGKVKGWQPSGLLSDGFLDKLTVFKGGDWVNINTSPVEVLSLHPDLSVQLSRQIVSGRPWKSIQSINDSLDVNLNVAHGDVFLAFSGTIFRIQIEHPDFSWGREYFLQLQNAHSLSQFLSLGDDAIAAVEDLELEPWDIRYVLDYPLDRDDALPTVQSTGLKVFSAASLASP